VNFALNFDVNMIENSDTSDQASAAAKEESDWDRDIEEDKNQKMRQRALTQRGLAFKMDTYHRIFKSLKNRSSYIKKMISDKVPTNIIRTKHHEWLKEFEQFMTLRSEIYPNLPEDEKEHFITQNEQNEIFLEETKGDIDKYFLTVHYDEEQEQERTVHPKRTKAKSTSSLKTTSSMETVVTKRLKEEQRIATLSAKKQSMAKRRQLEMAKLSLKFEEEELEVETNIAISTAKSQILKKVRNGRELL
jgi:hypothetical protein